MRLGDAVERALSAVGITKDRVERWLGPECGCDERQERLNAVGEWAERILKGRIEGAKRFLEGIMGEDREYVVPKKDCCRSCGGTDLTFLFSLGEQYVSDFPDSPDHDGIKAPLDLVLCRECSLVQNPWTAPQELLYTRHYWYRSGVTRTMRDSLAELTRTLYNRFRLRDGDVVLDIGSNDGTLLRSWPGRLYRIGVEPATNLREQGSEGIERLISDFWPIADIDLQAKVITACGMMYDLDDPNPFIEGVAKALHPEGVFVFQLMGARGMIEAADIGNLAHEHLEFYTLRSLTILLRRYGMTIFDLDVNSVNGQSYRIYASKTPRPEHWRVRMARQHEERMRLSEEDPYLGFLDRASLSKDWILEQIRRHPNREHWVYGASTKGNVILQWLGLDRRDIVAAADRSPEKWGRFTIGTGIPIRSEEDFREADPDVALVLPYAFLPEFVAREQSWIDRGGRFLVPFPDARYAP